MMLESIDKNAFEIITILNNLVLLWRFEDHTFVFFLVLEIVFLVTVNYQIWIFISNTV